MKNTFVTDGVGRVSANLVRQQLLMGNGTVTYPMRQFEQYILVANRNGTNQIVIFNLFNIITRLVG